MKLFQTSRRESQGGHVARVSQPNRARLARSGQRNFRQLPRESTDRQRGFCERLDSREIAEQRGLADARAHRLERRVFQNRGLHLLRQLRRDGGRDHRPQRVPIHDSRTLNLILHERDIRKASGQFAFLTDAVRRSVFMSDLNQWVAQSPLTIIAVVVRKPEFSKSQPTTANPYHVAMQLGLERVESFLRHQEGTGERHVHFIFEARGKREDDELELEFRRVCDGSNSVNRRLLFQLVFAGKQINSTGLQLADLTARPIGRYVMDPSQTNRAYEIIGVKLARHPTNGNVSGFGLTTYP